jgi:PAS domain S-box-containing protein
MAQISLSLPQKVLGQELHALLAQALESSYDAIIVTDAELDAPGPSILYCNAAFERVTGYHHDELLGQNPRKLQGPRTSKKVTNNIRAQLEAGQPLKASTWNYRKDGTPFFMEWSISPIRDEGGTITCFVAVQRDITPRLRRYQRFLRHERKLLCRILETQETERTRIGKDLHDSLGQKLSLVRMMFHMMEKHESLTAEMKEQMSQAAELIDESITELRSLAHALTPRVLISEGLSGALQHIVSQCNRQNQLQITLQCDEAVDELPDRDMLLLYRIVQEMMNNTMKHSGATEVFIRLEEEAESNRMLLEYTDNGKGMPIDSPPDKHSKGLGMTSIQDRVRLLKGNLVLTANQPTGVRFVIDFPFA